MRVVPSLLCLLATLSLAFPASGGFYDASQKVIGGRKTHVVKNGETVVEIARRFGLGFNELSESNPLIDPFIPEEGVTLTVPVFWVVPDVPPTATIVINLSELRLYYFFNAGSRRRLMTFPVGIGTEGNETPLGFFRVKEKRVSPSWRVPPSVRKERPELPAVVPPGEENPLGSHALRLDRLSILIHGTNRPWGVGRRVSHGCIRLYPEDIPILFDRVLVEDQVLIIRQPVKMGMRSGRIFMEVHDDPAETDYPRRVEEVLAKRECIQDVSMKKLLRVIAEKRGVPVDITRDPDEM